MHTDQPYPFVSVILPIRNESSYIASGLESIRAQDYPLERMEVLIADGMSTDNTRQIVADFAASHPELTIHILDNPGQIVPTGLNIALRKAKGEIIVRVDGHTLIAPDYVSQCVKVLTLTHAENAGGRMYAVGSGIFGEAVSAATSTPFGIGGGRFHFSEQEEWVDTVYMGAWPRRVFQKVGLFDEELVRDQDDEFNYRLRENGGKIRLSQLIRSEYTVRSTPQALWRQYFQYGFWKVRVLQKHPRQMSSRQFIPPVFVLGMLVSLLCLLLPDLRVLSGVVPGFYLAGNLLASFSTAARRGWRLLPYLMLTFAILHFSYGSGFLAGLAQFANRWNDKVGLTPGLGQESAYWGANRQQTNPLQ